jgi:hypothetical protein
VIHLFHQTADTLTDPELRARYNQLKIVVKSLDEKQEWEIFEETWREMLKESLTKEQQSTFWMGFDGGKKKEEEIKVQV